MNKFLKVPHVESGAFADGLSNKLKARSTVVVLSLFDLFNLKTVLSQDVDVI